MKPSAELVERVRAEREAELKAQGDAFVRAVKIWLLADLIFFAPLAVVIVLLSGAGWNVPAMVFVFILSFALAALVQGVNFIRKNSSV